MLELTVGNQATSSRRVAIGSLALNPRLVEGKPQALAQEEIALFRA